jgi:hypothetical protein
MDGESKVPCHTLDRTFGLEVIRPLWHNVPYVMSAKYCIFKPLKLMFVKLLALLFSNIFVSFSVLLCCRSLP